MVDLIDIFPSSHFTIPSN